MPGYSLHKRTNGRLCYYRPLNKGIHATASPVCSHPASLHIHPLNISHVLFFHNYYNARFLFHGLIDFLFFPPLLQVCLLSLANTSRGCPCPDRWALERHHRDLHALTRSLHSNTTNPLPKQEFPARSGPEPPRSEMPWAKDIYAKSSGGRKHGSSSDVPFGLVLECSQFHLV